MSLNMNIIFRNLIFKKDSYSEKKIFCEKEMDYYDDS